MNIESLREYCLSLHGATEDVKWEADLCFCIGGKMFCVTGLNESFTITVKLSPEEFDHWVERDGVKAAKYVGRYKWISILEPHRFPDAELKRLIEGSYQLIINKLSAKEKAQLLK